MEMEMEIQHFSHEHPLALSEIKDDEVLCQICSKVLSGSVYGCIGCEFFIHKSCADFPREIQLFFHPCLLILEKYPLPRKIISFEKLCKACGKFDESSFCYRCQRCEFNLDFKCALDPPKISEGDQQIQHFSHWHPLELIEIKTGKNKVRMRCNVCRKSCLDHTYGCQKCHFYIHESCMKDLPRQIQHFFHPCPLTLLIAFNHVCRACNQGNSGLAFCCGKCDFHLDVECALLPFKDSEGQSKIQHYLHGHPLTLGETSNDHEVDCLVCNQNSSDLSYSCSRCHIWLHKSCADRELPLEITHPFHPLHSLSLTVPGSAYSYCGACKRKGCQARYRCDKCSFEIDTGCVSLTPSIKYSGHQHLLTFFEKTGVDTYCNICKTSSLYLLLQCVMCVFSIHLYCHPLLPQTIKHKCHFHALTFAKSFYEDEYFPDDDEFYCDACETKRLKGVPVYYCTQCPFVAHINCVISEVLAPLNQEEDSSAEEMDSTIKVILEKLDKQIADLRIALKPLEEEKEQLEKALEAKRAEIKPLSKKLKDLEEERSLQLMLHLPEKMHPQQSFTG